MVGDFGYIHAQGSTVCERQTFSLVNCPESSNNGGINGDFGGESNEQQIPLLIPFP